MPGIVPAHAPGLASIPIPTSAGAAQGHGSRPGRLLEGIRQFAQELRARHRGEPAETPQEWRALSPSAELMVDPDRRARCSVRDTRAAGSDRFLWGVTHHCEFGSVRRRARHSAAPGRQGRRLSPRRAVCTVLADLRGGRRSRYRHDNHHGAASSAHGGAALLLRVLRAAARLPIAGLSGAGKLRTSELFWATLSPPVPRRWHGSGRAAAGS